MTDSRVSPGKALAEQAYQFAVWVTQVVGRLPRDHKFTIGDRLTGRAMSLIENIVESVYTRDRAPLLRRAQLDVEQMRYLFRICCELKLVNENAYEHAARTLDGSVASGRPGPALKRAGCAGAVPRLAGPVGRDGGRVGQGQFNTRATSRAKYVTIPSAPARLKAPSDSTTARPSSIHPFAPAALIIAYSPLTWNA